MEEKTDETKNNADNSLKSGAKNKSTTFPHIYSITIDETSNATSKSFVLIETASSEEHNLTVSLLKSKFPDASIFSSKGTEANADGEGDGEVSDVSESNHYSVQDSRNSSRSKTEFVNKILKAYQSRSKANQGDELLKYGECRSNRLSPTNSTSMERQESKDSGFWSLTKSSFESMKSLSLNDSMPLNELTSKLFVTGHADRSSDKLQQLSKGKKWKKEHVLRYNSFSETNKCLSEGSFEETSSNADTVRDEYSNQTTDSTDGFSRTGSLDNNDVEVEAKSSTGTSTPQKRRGKLIRDITIDDETSQVGQTSTNDNQQPKATECETTASSNDRAKQTATNQSSNSSLSKRIVQCKSPPEKRASLFFYEKKMSIDEAPTFDSSHQQTQSKCFCIDCNQNQKPISNLYSSSSNHTNLLVTSPKSTTNKPTNTNNNNNNMPNQMMPNNGQKSNGFFGQSVSFDSFRTSYGLLTKPTNSANSINPYLVRSYTSYDDDRYNSHHMPDPISNNLNGLQQQHSLTSGTKPPGKHMISPNLNSFHLNSNYSGLTAGQALLKPDMSFNTKSSKHSGSSTYRSTSADRNCDQKLCCKTEPSVSRSAAASTTTTISQQTDFHNTAIYNNNNNNRGTQDSSLNPFESMQKSAFANDLLNVIGNLNKSEQSQSRQNNQNSMRFVKDEILQNANYPSDNAGIDSMIGRKFPFSMHMFTKAAIKLNKRHANKNKMNKQILETNKPHVCLCCQKKFARSDMLIRHSRLHSGLRPYKCNQCGQEFSRSDHLNTHQRTHTGEKPYTCPYPKCTYAACRKDMITRHLKIHNKNRQPGAKQAGFNTMNAYASTLPLSPLFFPYAKPQASLTSNSICETKFDTKSQVDTKNPLLTNNNLIIPIIRIEET